MGGGEGEERQRSAVQPFSHKAAFSSGRGKESNKQLTAGDGEQRGAAKGTGEGGCGSRLRFQFLVTLQRTLFLIGGSRSRALCNCIALESIALEQNLWLNGGGSPSSKTNRSFLKRGRGAVC